MSILTSRITTNDPVLRLQETIRYFEQTEKYWISSVPKGYGFERDCRLVQDIVRSLGEHDQRFYKYLEKYIKGGFKDRSTHHGDQEIIKRVLVAISRGHLYFSKILEESNQHLVPQKPKKSFFRRSEPAIDYRTAFDIEAQNLRVEVASLEQNRRFAALTEKSVLNQFADELPIPAYEFWAKKLGSSVSVTWSEFAQAYVLLYGKGGPVKLARIEGYLFGNSNGRLNIFTIYSFLTLTRHHGFPFASSAEQSQDVTGGDRLDLAKVVIGLMDKFASSVMQQNLLTLAHYYRGIDKTESSAIEKRADEWAVARKESRMITDENQKTERHLEADRVDFARRSVSFFYQQYMVLWRVGQPQSDMLSEIDFPGKGRLREFVAYCKPLDYANFHYVLNLEPERWPTAQPDVYRFLKQLLVDKTKDAPRLKMDTTAPSTPKPGMVKENP
ncbi:hypothetical protein BJV82DRAFT_625557 [Fennellomyces sp. T-0311]|nr:hypothetical protein BJV82DRAFT_625557 [Fennellomyces sp. T-0311]